MQRKEPLNNLRRKPRRFLSMLLIFAGSGVLMSAVIIALSISELRSRADEINVTVTPSSTSVATATLPVSGSAPVVTGFPTPVPAADDLQEQRRIQVDEPAPDFTLGTLHGGEVTLSDFQGQAVLINFWATWCVPCRFEMPELVRAYQAHSDEGFTILAVNLTDQDSLEDVREFVGEFDMTFPVLLDESGQVSTLYGLLGLPTTVFVNREGLVQRIHIGLMSPAQIVEFVGEILA
ncbi:MAG: TlpA family protein disulfide reductase [Anaerolineae bacterium]|nr:TlpA family protein disulfide reductase [Anaerolineae bacterium]